MKKEINLEFDELDLKCLNEMPLLMDVLSSTGNKIIKLLNHFNSNLGDVLKENLPTGWNIHTKNSFETICSPITEYLGISKTTINSFSPELYIESVYQIYYGQEKSPIWYWLFMRYECFINEENIENRFLFGFEKTEVKDKNGGVLFPMSFYTKTQNEIKNYEIEILHPENNDKSEAFYIYVTEKKVSTLIEAYKEYKEYLVIPLITKLADYETRNR